MVNRSAFVAGLLLATGSGAAASPPPKAPAGSVQGCVQRNDVRYTTPDKALVAQYIDRVSACRALLDQPRAAIEVSLVAQPRPTPTAAAPLEARGDTQPAPPRGRAATRAPRVEAPTTTSHVAEVRAALERLEQERPLPVSRWWDGAPRSAVALVVLSGLLTLTAAARGRWS